MENQSEFEKIRDAFDRVKKDLFFLTQKVNRIEMTKNESEIKLLKEIELLKLRIYALDKENEKVVVQKKEEYSIIGNNDSKKVHFSNCPYAHKISKEHKVVFKTLNEALRNNYDACSCTHN